MDGPSSNTAGLNVLLCDRLSRLSRPETFSMRGRHPNAPMGPGTARAPRRPKPAGRPHESDQDQKSQSSSSVTTALPMTYDEPDPEKKSWFSSAFGDSADRIAGFTSVVSLGNIGS